VGAVQRVLVPGNCTLVRRDNQKHFASQGPISLFFKKEKEKKRKKDGNIILIWRYSWSSCQRGPVRKSSVFKLLLTLIKQWLN
jgi:hypothetical protein